MTARAKRPILAIVLAVLASFGLVRAAEALVLAVPQCYQQQSLWCWAACSQAILRFYGVNRTQIQIAAYGTLGVNSWNWLYGDYDEGDGVTRKGIDMILSHFGSIATERYVRALSQEESMAQINGYKPFVVRWYWDTGGGHFVVARGIDGDTVYLMDPGTETGPTVNVYSWVVKGGGHTWTHSLTMNAPPTNVGRRVIPAAVLLLGE